MIASHLQDRATAIEWADKVLAFEPDPQSHDPWEQSFASRTPEAETAMEAFDELVRRARGAARKAGMKPADVRRAVAKVRASR